MTIGLLCARSLHYQFYAYLGWATPYLLWRSGVHPALVVANLALQEFAWLRYPSTVISSVTVVVEMMVALTCVWYGSAYQPEVEVKEEEPQAHSK
jgi:alpha-1,3-mannosyltransferase